MFTSNLALITHGVPQGSILGPLLFLLYINDLPHINSFFKFDLYADDSTLTCKFDNNDSEYIKNRLENEIVSINDWLMMNKIKVNYSKSKYMCFSFRGNRNIGDIHFGPNSLSNTSSTKFLGIHLDENLNFSLHVDKIASKISKTTGVLYRLNKFLPENTLKMLYNSLVLPHIQYGLEVWYSCSDKNQKRIFTLQKKCIRAIKGLRFRDHTNDHFKSLKLLKLEDLYKINLLIHIHLRNDLFLHSDQHHHYTRNRNNIVTPFFSHAKCQKTWLYKATSFWNDLPNSIKEINSSNKFKKTIKNYFIQRY